MKYESAPKGAQESATTDPIVSHRVDIGAQLGRIEGILDRILRSLASLAGAR